MTTHARQKIREAVAALLKVTPTKWGPVFETRIPTGRAVMPYLMVFADGEAAESISANMPGIYLRDLNIAVAGRLKLPGNNDTQTVEDRMDAVAAEVESKLAFSALLAALPQIKSIRLTNTEMVVVIDDQDSPQYAEVTLSYVMQDATAAAAPTTLI
jgi:hypothetical protein